MNIFTVSWKSVWNRKWSSILSIILIAFGVGLLSLLAIFNKQFEEQFEKNQAGIDLVVGAKGSPLQLILNAMFHVDAPTGNIKVDDAKFLFNPKNPFIEDAIPLSIGDSYKTFRIIGTDHKFMKLYDAELQAGELWDKPMEVLVGAQVAREANLKLGDSFFSSHGFNKGDLEHDDVAPFIVKGLLSPHGSVVDKLILTSYQSIWDVHAGHDHGESESHGDHNHEDHNHGEESEHHSHSHHKPDSTKSVDSENPLLQYPDKSITSVLVRFKEDKKRAIPVINMPRNINENTPLMATSPTYQLNKLIANVGSGLTALSYLAYLIAFISALSIFISLYNNLKERKYELAIMRISGGRPFQLALLVFFEAIIIGIIGAIMGIILAHVGIFVLSQLLDAQFHYSLQIFRIYPAEILLFLATIVISIIAAIIPAIKAYSTNIVKSL